MSRHRFDDLIARKPHAYLTLAVRAYVGHGLLRHDQFESLQEHQRYAVFHLPLSYRMQEAQ
jgi:hypothetical protein